MQTNFALADLADPQMQESEKILRTCVHCGLCTATCPTYLLLGDELDSPRGRIYLIKDMLENGKPANAHVVRHIDRCLSCLSCMTTCPSGVHYMHLVDHARAHIEKTYRRPFADRFIRSVLAKVLPSRRLFSLALGLAAIGRPLRPVLARLPGMGPRLAAMLDLSRRGGGTADGAPAGPQDGQQDTQQDTQKNLGTSKGRVALFEGCAQPVLQPSINAAARRLLARMGFEAVRVEGEACCGALVHHMGREEPALDHARRNIDAWMRELDGAGLDAIVITTSGCGTNIKDYGFMLRNDAAYARNAARISALALDVSEFLSAHELPPAKGAGPGKLKLAYHSACSLQHGQQVGDAPRRLLGKAGFKVRDVAESHICCGSAGTYNILQPAIAQQLRDRKVANIERLAPDVIAAGNIGCMTQIGTGTDIPVVHTVELLDWATGGPVPYGLGKLA